MAKIIAIDQNPVTVIRGVETEVRTVTLELAIGEKAEDFTLVVLHDTGKGIDTHVPVSRFPWQPPNEMKVSFNADYQAVPTPAPKPGHPKQYRAIALDRTDGKYVGFPCLDIV